MAVRAAALEFIAITDATGERRELPRYPRRIVSLSPALTQTLFDLGLDHQIVGLTRACTVPKDRARGVEKVGGPKDPDTARVVDLLPDLVLMDLDQNRREDVELLAGQVPVFAFHVRGVEEAVASIETMGILVDREEQAGDLTARVRTEAEASRAWARGRSRLRGACLVSKDPWIAATSETYVHDLLSAHGLDNVFASRSGPYAVVEPLDLVTTAPHLILLLSDPYRFKPKHREELLEQTAIPASQKGQVHVIDGTLLLSYGSRMLRAFPFLREFFDKLEREPREP